MDIARGQIDYHRFIATQRFAVSTGLPKMVNSRMPSGTPTLCGQPVIVKRTKRHVVGGISSNSIYLATSLLVLSRTVVKLFPSVDTSILYRWAFESLPASVSTGVIPLAVRP